MLATLCLGSTFGCANLNAETPPTTGTPHPELRPFDTLALQFIEEYGVPGMSLAVAKNGNLVLARGYGWSDQHAEEPVQPDTRFRIASVSKPVTAFAVTQLIDQGKIDLDTPVLRQFLSEAAALTEEPKDPRWNHITPRHLLQHTAGFDRKASFDPMFRSRSIASAQDVPPPADGRAITRHMLGRDLDFDPGTQYAYSNFGYLLLGQLIESVTHQDYETYVREEVLERMNIRDMALGRTLLDHRSPKESRYYASGLGPSVFESTAPIVPRPYGAWFLEPMAAHGGWIATATDLVRLAAALDDSNIRPFSEEALDLMIEAPTGSVGHDDDGSRKDVYYGFGWKVRHVNDQGDVNLWHLGSLDGTSSILVRRYDGLVWAALFNSRARVGPESQEPAAAIDSLLHRAAAQVVEWPEGTPLF